MATTALNHWAVFRFGLSYPDERHLERFAELCDNVPRALQELRSLYIDLFEAGLPQPRCPLLESASCQPNSRCCGAVVLPSVTHKPHPMHRSALTAQTIRPSRSGSSTIQPATGQAA